MTWNASYRLQLLFKVISVLTPQGTNWRKDFKVKVFNKQFNDQEDTFQSITEYIYSD